MTKRSNYGLAPSASPRGVPVTVAAPVAGPDLTGINWSGLGRRNGGRGKNPIAFVGMSTTKATADHKYTTMIVSFYLPAMQVMGWRVGDRVLVGLTADRAWVVVRRVTDATGYKLSALSSRPKDTLVGTVTSASVRVPHPDVGPWPMTYWKREEIHIDLAGGMLAIPLAVLS